jgi:small subunit ribosomal protein S1
MTDSTPRPDALSPECSSLEHNAPAPGTTSAAQMLDNLRTQGDADIDRAVEQAVEGVNVEALSDAAAPAVAAESAATSEVLSGRIANVGSQDVLIDFGGKCLGAMPLAEFDKGETYQVGDEIQVMVVDPTPVNGLIAVSRRKARQSQLLATLKVGTIVEGVVTGMNKGGLEVDLHGLGLRGFIPASQVDLRFMKDISNLIGQSVRAEVTKFDDSAGDIVLSRRNCQMKEAAERKERVFGELEVGQVRKGRVRSLSEFGAFVDIGGVDALLHISDMSWGRVNKPEEVVKVGDEIEAKIIKIQKDKKKISLSLKEVQADPWLNIDQKYAVGTKLQGRVVRLQNFGAFVELEPGVDGLIPVSEISWTRRIHNPAEVLKEGDVVEVAVIGLDKDKKRISLSLKQTTTDPWTAAAEKYTVGLTLKAKIVRTADFGAFVALEDGIDGLIHISELSEQRVRAVTDKVKAGDEVEVRVLAVDPANHRVSLSMKPPPKMPTPEELAEMARRRAAEEKQREKKRAKQASRRGGLTIAWGEGLGSLDPSKFSR